MNRFTVLLAAACVCLAGAPMSARTISFSSAIGDQLFDSLGNPLDATFSFEIGIFTNGFIPTAHNIGDWNAHWMIFDLAFHDSSILPPGNPASGGWNVLLQYFTSAADFGIDGTSNSPYASSGMFPQGSVVYLWAYNSKTLDPTSEWALATDLNLVANASTAWRIPDPMDQLSPSISLSLADLDTPILGGVNGIQGAGNVTNIPGSFSLQTYVIPEPSSALLLVLGVGLLGVRRRSV
jgi:hypothetical protein